MAQQRPYRLVRQSLSKQLHGRAAQAPQMQIEAAQPPAPHLHGREVGVAGEGQRRQFARAGVLPIDLNNKLVAC